MSVQQGGSNCGICLILMVEPQETQMLAEKSLEVDGSPSTALIPPWSSSFLRASAFCFSLQCSLERVSVGIRSCFPSRNARKALEDIGQWEEQKYLLSAKANWLNIEEK